MTEIREVVSKKKKKRIHHVGICLLSYIKGKFVLHALKSILLNCKFLFQILKIYGLDN